MFLRQLEYLVALAHEQHFSRAARHCNVSQPSLSNAIKQLEAEFGTPIVLRHQRFQGFTAEGSRIVEWSKRILADRDAMLQELSVLKSTLAGRIRLGAMPTSSPVPPHMHERRIIDAAFASVGKSPTPLIESDSIVNLAFHTMLGGVVTVVPSHFELVIGGFPRTRVVKLTEPEVVREVGLIWVGGDPMLPMAKAMLDALKAMTIPELVKVPPMPLKLVNGPTRQPQGHGRRPARR
jgi:DNA-binding transcriptional LysR family regulator